jgi:serine/threonine protein kinase
MTNVEGDMYHKIRSTQGKKFEEYQVIDWAIQMCLAIYHMHDRRILHRDLKTQNIFLTNGKIKLGDFGISKVLDSTVQLTSTVIGTPYYMSPEQFKYKPYSYKTDIWALGCVIYEMCSLRHAFDAQSINALAVKVLKGNFAPLANNYSKGLKELVGKMLSINPKDRPTIVQVLKAPILRKRLVSYIQSCMK